MSNWSTSDLDAVAARNAEPRRTFTPSPMSADEGKKLLEGTPQTKAAKGTKNDFEHEMQRDGMAWFKWKYPQYYLLFFCIPNGAKLPYKTIVKRGKKIHVSPERQRLMDEGMKPGVSDTFLSIARGGYHGLYIENKILPNKPTLEQIAFLDAVIKQGYMGQVAYTYEQLILIIDTYLSLPPTEVVQP